MIETQIEHRIRRTLESNIALVAALERLRESYNQVHSGKPAKDADRILAQVEAALNQVEKTSM
jgi:hypothetical protein